MKNILIFVASLIFVSDAALPIKDLDSGCNSLKLQQGFSGSFSSLNFPNDYDNNLRCSWYISVPTDQYVLLEFEKQFDVHKSLSSSICTDTITIGTISLDEPIAKLCGSTAPPDIVVRDNTAYVIFQTDAANTRMGFKLKWSAISTIPTTPPRRVVVTTKPNITYEVTEAQSSGPDSGCGSPTWQRGKSGLIWSKNYPNNYPPQLKCKWKISVPVGQYIAIDFNPKFNIENCYDNLNVYSPNNELLGRYCGDRTPENPIIFKYDKISVIFLSDNSKTETGFKLTWRAINAAPAVDSGCGNDRMQTGIAGSFSSKNYPREYENNLRCEWIIKAPSRNHLSLQFDRYINLEKGTDCLDSVKIYGVYETSEVLIGTYCGTYPPEIVYVHSSTAKVVFQTDYSTTKDGFKLVWKALDPDQHSD